jgi:hypothetical protein
MLRFNQSTNQIRIDTTIKIIEKDGTEVIAPVVVMVYLNKIEEKHQHNVYKLSNSLFNKMFLLDRIKIAKAKQPNKPWWKVW